MSTACVAGPLPWTQNIRLHLHRSSRLIWPLFSGFSHANKLKRVPFGSVSIFPWQSLAAQLRRIPEEFTANRCHFPLTFIYDQIP